MRRLLWAVVCVGFVGCKPSEVQFDGDVFIVMKGGNGIKLALVEVQLVPAAPMKDFIAKRVPEASARVEAGLPELRSLVKTWHEAQPAWDEARKVWMATPYEQTAAYEAAKAKEVSTRDAVFGAGRVAFAAAKKLEDLGSPTGEFFRTGRPAAVFSAKTDADGKFTMKVAPGDYAVIAHASRMIDKDKVEEYDWMVWKNIEAKQDQPRLMLTNDNLVDTHCADCLVMFADTTAVREAMKPQPSDAGL